MENEMLHHDSLEEVTGVGFIDSVKKDWGPPGMYFQTSLSSDFPWKEWKLVKTDCKTTGLTMRL